MIVVFRFVSFVCFVGNWDFGVFLCFGLGWLFCFICDIEIIDWGSELWWLCEVIVGYDVVGDEVRKGFWFN